LSTEGLSLKVLNEFDPIPQTPAFPPLAQSQGSWQCNSAPKHQIAPFPAVLRMLIVSIGNVLEI